MKYKEKNVRSMALKAIGLIVHNKTFSNVVVKDYLKYFNTVVDQNFFRELVYGVTENLTYLDYMIRKSTNIRLKKINQDILNILRIGLYEIVFLNVKDYATVNELVEIAKTINKHSNKKESGFVNGVLRNSIRNLDKIKQIESSDTRTYLNIRYSFNFDIIDYLIENYGELETKRIIKALSEKPELCIRVNDNKVRKEEVFEILDKYNFKPKYSKIADNTIILENPTLVTETKEFQKGMFTIQDQASIKVSEVLNPTQNSTILDLCAAPGSKSTHLSQISHDKSLIISNDISTSKLKLIEDNFNRLGFNNYKIKNYDATINIEEFNDKFDYILVDAPCSGIGVIKRKPEIKLYRTMNDIVDLSEIQKKILVNAFKYLKSGGKLVYSTCTLGIIENQNVVKHALDKVDGIVLDLIEDKEYLEYLPHKFDSDGFFIAKFSKN